MENINIFTTKLAVSTRETDWDGCVKLSSLFAAMQEAGQSHSERLGGGMAALRARGYCWVLLKSALRVGRYARYGETLDLRTFPQKTRHGIYPRYYDFTDAAGQIVARAATAWAILSIAEKRIAQPAESGFDVTVGFDGGETIPQPRVFRPADGPLAVREYRPVYADCDINGHVNNTRYADWLCDGLFPAPGGGREISAVEVFYHAEVLAGETLALETADGGKEASLIGRCGGEARFTVAAALRPRTAAKT